MNAQHQRADNEKPRSRSASFRIRVEVVKLADLFAGATEVLAIGVNTVEIIEWSDLPAGRAPAVAIVTIKWADLLDPKALQSLSTKDMATTPSACGTVDQVSRTDADGIGIRTVPFTDG